MLQKIVELPSQFSTGEPTVQFVATGGKNSRTLRNETSLHRVKTASESPALDLVRSIQPEPGKTIVLIIGLGDSETYGPNRRGDAFPSEPIPGLLGADDVLTKHCQSYDNALVYRHHINHDPAGAIGKVIKAFWNPYMRRVEVVESFDHDKAPDLLEQVTSGQPLAKSMGCLVPYDICTVCGNRAVSRDQLCSDLRNNMLGILPDGRQVAAINPRPRFFDSSWVRRPADRTGYMLRKVADMNTGRTYELWSPSGASKEASISASMSRRLTSSDIAKVATALRARAEHMRKLADIEKILSGTLEGSASGFTDGTLTLVRRYAEHTGACTEAPSNGSTGTVSEVTYTPRGDGAPGTETPGNGLEVKVASLGGLLTHFLDRAGVVTTSALLRSSLAHAGDVQAIFAEYPRFYADVCKVANLRDDVTNAYHRVETEAAPFVDISKTLGSNNLEMRPLTDKLTSTDPHGHTYQKTGGPANKARNFDAVANKTRPLQLGLSAVGLGNVFGGAGHSALLHRPSKEMLTNEGERITTNTEMVRTASAPEMAAVDFRSRDGRPMKLATSVRSDLWAAVKAAEVVDDLSDALGVTLDLERVCAALGRSVMASIR